VDADDVGMRPPVGPAPDDERLSVFRDFINSLDIDDLDRPERSS